MNWAHFAEIIQRHRLVYAVSAAIGMALLLSAVSMSLYISSGASQLDLSRPGYEKARTEIDESKSEARFEATGPMNASVIDEFQKLFTGHRDKMNALDDFDSTALDDTQLRLSSE